MFSNRYSVVFPLSERFAYRDPAAYIKDGTVYLFFSLVENAPTGSSSIWPRARARIS